MFNKIDSLKYLDPITQKVISSWIKRDRKNKREIPWTPLEKPLSECRIAMISSAAVAMADDEPFDQQTEREKPFWGDPSFRVLPKTATEKDVRFYHLHINTKFGEQDLNCVFPLTRLGELAKQGVIGSVADSHYSFMGYILDETELVEKTTPVIIEKLQADEVDAVVLVPV